MSDAIVSYAALILSDADLEITSENLSTLIKAAGASVDSIWTETFATALQGQDLKTILAGFATVGSGAGSSAGAAAAGASGAAEEAAEEKEEEAAEESDDEMGFGLFD